jgi:hypothetical protein
MRIASCVVQPVRVRNDDTVSGTHLVVRLQSDAGVEGIEGMGRALGEYEPYWIEDPVAAPDVSGLRHAMRSFAI